MTFHTMHVHVHVHVHYSSCTYICTFLSIGVMYSYCVFGNTNACDSFAAILEILVNPGSTSQLATHVTFIYM